MTKSPIWEGTWDWNQPTNCAFSPSQKKTISYIHYTHLSSRSLFWASFYALPYFKFIIPMKKGLRYHLRVSR